MMKISKNWLTHLLFATLQAPRLGLVGAVSLQKATMASNMILNTLYNTQQVKKLVSKSFKLQNVVKISKILLTHLVFATSQDTSPPVVPG